MSENYKYAVLGSGMQGTALGYDLARFGGASRIIMCDIRNDAAQVAAGRINVLSGKSIAEGHQLNAEKLEETKSLLSDVDTCCGAAHYALNLGLTRISIDSGCHFCDMGGNTGVVRQQHKLNSRAKEKGVSVIPDCGLAPGLGNTLAARALDHMNCTSIQIRCGGLPQNPQPPLGYAIVFSVAGIHNTILPYRSMRGKIPGNMVI